MKLVYPTDDLGEDLATDEDPPAPEYPDISGDVEESINAMQPYVHRWNRCLEFVRGNQSFLSDQASYSYGTARPQKKGLGVQINKLLPIYRNIVARLATAYPSIAALPASDSPEDLLKSRADEQALRYVWSAAKIKDVLRQATELIVATGNAALHEYYEDTTGNVKVDAIRPHDLVYEPYVTCPEESEWVVIRCYATKAELNRLYPDKRGEIEEYAPTPVSKMTNGPQSQPKNRVEYRHVYWKDGRRAIMLGKHYLWTGETAGGLQPVQLIKYSSIPGFLWGVGLIEPLLDLQTLYNRTRDQIIINIQSMANPKILLYENSLRDPGKAFTGDPGEKVWLTQGAPAPSPFANASLPPYALEEPQRLELEMQDTSGIHSVSLGKRVVGVSSGKAINALSQNDMSQLQLTQENIEAAVSLMATCVLVLMQHHYTEAKMVRMLDATGIVVFKELRATDLTENPEVFLEAGTLFRSEAQDREARVYDLLEAGLIDAEEAKRALAFRLMPLDLVDKMEALRHANQLLEAELKFTPKPGVKSLLEIDQGDNSDLDTIRQVFHRFTRTEAYYSLPAAKQDQVYDAYQKTLQAAKAPAPMIQQQPSAEQPPDPLNEAVQGLKEPIIQSNEAMLRETTAQQPVATPITMPQGGPDVG